MFTMSAWENEKTRHENFQWIWSDMDVKLIRYLHVSFDCFLFILIPVLLPKGIQSCLIKSCPLGCGNTWSRPWSGTGDQERTAPSPHFWTQFLDLVHLSSFHSEKNGMILDKKEFILSKRRHCKLIKTGPTFPCFNPCLLEIVFRFSSLLYLFWHLL